MCHSPGSASQDLQVPGADDNACFCFYLSPQYASLINGYLTLTWHLRTRTTSSPLRGLIHSSRSSCPRALRVLMTSCACHSIPVWEAPSALHPVFTASLRTNKMAHVCREDSVDTSLGVQIPDGQAVTTALDPKGQDAVQTHMPTHHPPTQARLPITPSPLCAPQALPTPCIAAHPYVEPLLSLLHHPRHVFTLARRLWASCRPLASLLFDGTLVLVSPVEATTICRLSGLDRGAQAIGLFRSLVSIPRIPPPACLMSPPPSPPLFERFVTRPLLRLGSPAVVPGP